MSIKLKYRNKDLKHNINYTKSLIKKCWQSKNTKLLIVETHGTEEPEHKADNWLCFLFIKFLPKLDVLEFT
jgi:hypothetical protein